MHDHPHSNRRMVWVPLTRYQRADPDRRTPLGLDESVDREGESSSVDSATSRHRSAATAALSRKPRGARIVARCIDVSRTARKPLCLRRRSLLPTSRPWPTCGSGWDGFPWIGSGSTPRRAPPTEKDVIEAEERENRLCELVDGTLVEKAVGFEEVATGHRARHT